MTQEDAILQALQGGARLTASDALKLCGCMRLAARIYDLRQKGYAIEERVIHVETRSGTARVSEYRIKRGEGLLFESKPDFKWE